MWHTQSNQDSQTVLTTSLLDTILTVYTQRQPTRTCVYIAFAPTVRRVTRLVAHFTTITDAFASTVRRVTRLVAYLTTDTDVCLHRVCFYCTESNKTCFSLHNRYGHVFTSRLLLLYGE
ncbi:hypothetical protein J6590_088917 [Homalodisca vitripennis]|nr:hypothetical protein J6590_088917 [Homalodisca vitripennis]